MAETTYTPEDFEEFCIELDPEAPPVEVNRDEVPQALPERFEKLLRHNPRIRALWERDPAVRFPSGKQSDSEYAASLMWHCGANGFTDAECAAILRTFYARPGMKPLHPSKESRTLRLARKGREQGNVWDPSGVETVIDEVPTNEEQGERQERQPPEEEPGISASGEASPPPQDEPPSEAPREDLPPFPEKAFVGLAGEFATTYAERLESPQQFFYLDYLAFLGAIISPYVRLDTQLHEEPRIYGVKVGVSWLSR